MEYFDACSKRRTYYNIGNESPVADARIEESVKNAVKNTPSAFNSQTSRVVLLFGAEHEKLWNMTKEILRARVPADKFAATEAKINSFAAGHGTILYYEDQDIVKGLQEKFPSYAENFPYWSLESSGMLQFVIWSGLEAEGLVCSLQHYNPLIDSKAAEAFGIPSNWKLWAEMPFGKPAAAPGEKEFADLEERVKIF